MNTDTWTQIGQKMYGLGSNDRFGFSVATSGTGQYIAVSSYQYDPNGNTDRGRVKVYYFNEESELWVTRGNEIYGENNVDLMGFYISLTESGHRIAVSAIGTDVNGSRSGSIYVYEYNIETDNWDQIGQPMHGDYWGDRFGFSCQISGDGSTVIGGSRHNDTNGTNSGHIKVYTYDGQNDVWVQKGESLPGYDGGDRFGITTSISHNGSIIASGAPYANDNGGNSGHVRVYGFDGIQWVQLGSTIPGDYSSDEFGSHVKLDSAGLQLVIGSPRNDDNGSNSGQVKVYIFNTGTMEWEQLGQTLLGDNNGDRFGTHVDMTNNGMGIIIGAPRSDTPDNLAGSVYVYEYNPNTELWEQVGNIITGDFEGDRLGEATVISFNNGKYMIVCGAHMADIGGGDTGTPMGGNANSSGQVTVYSIDAPCICEYGMVEEIQDFYLINDDNGGNGGNGGTTIDDCDYVINAVCNLNNVFVSLDLDDPNGFTIDNTGLLDEIQNSLLEVLDANENVIDRVRDETDLNSWINTVPKYWANAEDIPTDFAQIENQHFTFRQSNGANGEGFYAVPRGGILDKLVRIYLHSSAGLSSETTTNYNYVTKLIINGLSEQQNNVGIFNGTDPYHNIISSNITNKVNVSNVEFKAQLNDYSDCLLEKLYFDLEDNTYTQGALTETYVLTGSDGPVTIDYTISGETSSLINSPRMDTIHRGDDNTAQDVLYFDVDQSILVGGTNELNIDVNFNTIVQNVAFKLYDVDGELGVLERSEQFVITGYDGITVVHPDISTPSQSSTIVINTSTSTVTGQNPIDNTIGSEDGVVLIRFNSAIDRFNIKFSVVQIGSADINNRPSFSMSDMEFYVPKTIDRNNVDMDNTSMVFYFDYRFKNLTVDELNHNNTLYNNEDPDSGNPTAIETSDTLKKICLRLSHQA
jgi:hypothetical protein